MLKLLVVDMSVEFTEVVEQIFESDFEIQICHDGLTAIEQLRSFRPDALVLNLQLPGKDGFAVLQESEYRPRVILAATNFMPPYVESRAAELGIQYILYTPTMKSLQLRLMDLVAKDRPRDAYRVAVHLHNLGFRTNLDGYRQLRAGIPIFSKCPGMLLSKELYPAIGELFCLPDCRTVEHSVRKAINDAWDNRDILVWEKYFPGAHSAPTNKAFISRMAEMLEL